MSIKFKAKQTLKTFHRKFERVKPTKRMKMERSPAAVTFQVILKKIIHFLWLGLSLIIRKICVWSYGDKGESMPPINDLILLDSATSLATKIRTRKVSIIVECGNF